MTPPLRALVPMLLIAAPGLSEDVAKTDRPKLHCRSETAIGSRVVTKTCHTTEEWRKIERAERDATSTSASMYDFDRASSRGGVPR